MSSFRTGLTAATWVAVCALSASTSVAQTVPWVLFPDSLTFAACDVVNAENAELVVLLATGELVIVSGSDVIIDGSFVDIDAPGPPWLVFFFGDPAGFVDFAVDGDGLTTLWWLSLTGTAVHVDGFTGDPSTTDLFPSDFFNVPCDAAPFWDGCLDDLDCDDGDPCTLDFCDGGACEASLIFACIDGRDDDPVITVNLCGTDTVLSLAVIAMGMGFLGKTRRRFV